MSNIFDQFTEEFKKHRASEEMTLSEYFNVCKDDKLAYATAAERMLAAIGEPEVVDTSKDDRLGRIFSNRKIKIYPAFSDFYGAEEPIEQIVSYFKHAAQGLEEKKQVLYLLGPVGGGKSSLSERLKELMQAYPIYTVKVFNHATGRDEVSPHYETPFGLFDYNKFANYFESDYNIPSRYLKSVPSPWLVKRLEEHDGKLDDFKVVKIYPSILKQIGITKTEPGDENNQDISSLVGKVDIRKLEDFSQDDPDAYSYAGGLNPTSQGMLEFIEMFKAPIKMLHPLLTATQEGNYNGTQGFGAMPFNGTILAHSNESEWESFRTDKRNEAFLDRVYIVKVPYCLRVTEEQEIYKKLLESSDLKDAPCAPGTLRLLAEFAVMTRLETPENSGIYAKMKAYDGKNVKADEPAVKTIREYKEEASNREGMSGVSTRFAYKILSKVFNYDPDEVAANPVHLFIVLSQQIDNGDIPESEKDNYRSFLKKTLTPKYVQFIGDEIQKAYLESYNDYGQNLFTRYIQFADAWKKDDDFRDPNTGEMFNRDLLHEELQKIEKPANISNYKEFRDEVVTWVLRWRADNNGEFPSWKSYNKIKRVIERKMFSNTEDLLPIISFSKKATEDEQAKHNEFLRRMEAQGYTAKQVRILVEWFIRCNKHS